MYDIALQNYKRANTNKLTLEAMNLWSRLCKRDYAVADKALTRWEHHMVTRDAIEAQIWGVGA